MMEEKTEERKIQSDLLKYNVFELFNYGVSKTTIFSLADARIPPYNILINGVSACEDLNISAPKKIYLINAIQKMYNNQDQRRNVNELMYMGISKTTCEALIDKNLTIEMLKQLSLEELKDMFDVKNGTCKKIKNAILIIDQIIDESNKNIDTKGILEKFIKDNASDSEISIFTLKQRLVKETEYILENYQKDINQLFKDNKISFGLFGLKYNYISFKEYLYKNLDPRTADIVVKRYDGYTLENIAQEYNITRERVRQIIEKLGLKNINIKFYEDKYKDIFEKYKWTEEVFKEVFSESSFTYNYLKLNYKIGEKNILEILSDNDFSELQKNIIKRYKKAVILSDGDVIFTIDEFTKKVMIKYAQEEIKIEELTRLFNITIENYPELKISKISSRNLEARLSRTDYVIFGHNHKVRFFDFNSLSAEVINQLKDLIEIDSGFYSTEVLFRNNINLMRELDIRNEYELHNILKLKIDDEKNDVYFIRMPNFLVGYNNKDDFILDKIRALSPISLYDFIDFLNEEYGHKTNTMLTYLSSNFNEYLDNGVFVTNTIKLEASKIEFYRKIFKNDIYIIDDVKSILKEFEEDDINLILTNLNFSKIGYKLKGSYMIKNDFGNTYAFLDYKIKSNEIIHLDESLLHIGQIYNAINFYCKKMMLFMLSKNIFLPITKLNEIGISNDDLNNLVKNLKIAFFNNHYFSIYNIYSELDLKKFQELGFDDKFIENIVFSLPDIATLRINNNRLFSFKNKNLSISQFMYDMVEKYESISLDELENKIYEQYGIIVPYDKLRTYLYSTDIFYSDILGKIYSDKEKYYEEVYDE